MPTNWSTMPVIGCLLTLNASWLIFPRVKAFLGKFILTNLLMVKFKKINCEMSEVTLFGTDVATDWVNGSNLIEDEHIIWGTVMCILPLVPAGITVPLIAFKVRRWYSIVAFLILYIPLVAIVTPLYIGIVLFTGILKVWDPELSKKEDLLFGADGWDLIFYSSVCRILEIVTESCPQSILGESTLIIFVYMGQVPQDGNFAQNVALFF